MKKYKFPLLIAAAISVLAACNKVTIVPIADFNVTVPKTTYKVGDSVIFTFTGNPDNVSFFSGEPTHIYANRNRIRAASATNNFSFTSMVTATGQLNNLSILASSNFSGIYDSVNVKNATWKDITSRAVLGTTTTNVASGTIDVTDFQSAADSLYLAFHYLSTPSTTANRARAWTVGSFVFNNVFPDGTTYTHGTLNTDARYGGFQAVSLSYDSLKWGLGGSLTFALGNIGQTIGDDDWAISKSFKLLRVAPDVGVGIKNISQFLTTYLYKYTKAGTYNVTFAANNTEAYGTDSTSRSLTLTITP